MECIAPGSWELMGRMSYLQHVMLNVLCDVLALYCTVGILSVGLNGGTGRWEIGSALAKEIQIPIAAGGGGLGVYCM